MAQLMVIESEFQKIQKLTHQWLHSRWPAGGQWPRGISLNWRCQSWAWLIKFRTNQHRRIFGSMSACRPGTQTGQNH
jgi:hypothetical protein